jgi:hypothetical protein
MERIGSNFATVGATGGWGQIASRCDALGFEEAESLDAKANSHQQQHYPFYNPSILRVTSESPT